jgi:hypothetical protein
MLDPGSENVRSLIANLPIVFIGLAIKRFLKIEALISGSRMPT